jgi:hypothetical protein
MQGRSRTDKTTLPRAVPRQSLALSDSPVRHAKPDRPLAPLEQPPDTFSKKKIVYFWSVICFRWMKVFQYYSDSSLKMM